MKIVQIDDVERKRGLEHRGGTFHSRTMVEGTPGTPGNFKFSLSELGTDYSGPRHRHNFDQFRFALEGESEYGQDGTLKAGMLGYYPEGIHYGPQVNKTPIVNVVLQFGGASGSGYMSQEQMEAGTAELKKQGTFEKGVFRRNESEAGKRNVDGYQAVWENVSKRPMRYPEPRYNDPVMMNPGHFDWVPVGGMPGVYDKLMGVFTERRCAAQFFKLDPLARFKGQGRAIYFVLSGAGQVAGEPYRQLTTIYCEDSDDPNFVATSESEMLMLGLPRLGKAIPHAVAAQ